MPPTNPYPIGRRIVGVRALTEEELAAHGWSDEPNDNGHVVLMLDDGSIIYPSSDYEGNEPGVLFVTDAGGRNSILQWREVDADFKVVG